MKSRLSALIGAAILTGALAAGCTSDDSGDAGESTTTTSTSGGRSGSTGCRCTPSRSACARVAAGRG